MIMKHVWLPDVKVKSSPTLFTQLLGYDGSGGEVDGSVDCNQRFKTTTYFHEMANQIEIVYTILYPSTWVTPTAHPKTR